MTILLIGATGTGKTWVMNQLIGGKTTPFAAGLVRGLEQAGTLYLGVYDGSVFEGSDKLAMNVSRDFDLLKSMKEAMGYNIVCEGDRFMNKKFIEMFSPYIIKIDGNGAEGRTKRGTIQSERQIKSIQTRVNNIKADATVVNSAGALKLIKIKLEEKRLDKPSF